MKANRVAWFFLMQALILSSCSFFGLSRKSAEIRLAEKVDFNTRREWKLAQKAKKRKLKQNPNYKQRYPEKAWDWFYSRRMNFETKKIPIDYREKALKHSRKFNELKAGRDVPASWTPLGPYPPRGRLKDIVVDPANENSIYVGSASGGVWKTTDQGLNWSNLTDNKIPTLGIGALIMDPANSNILYAGLGEGLYGRIYEPIGSGVYKTTDGGYSWSLTPGSGSNAMQVTVDLQFGVNSQTIYAACLGVYYGQTRGYEGEGFFKTTDGGQTWTNTREARCWSISVDPADRTKLILTTDEGDQARIYYSENSGDTFTPSTIPSDSSAKRIELARAESSPLILYALIGGDQRQMSGIWKSTDGGKNWSATSLSGIPVDDANEKPGQMTYNNCIAVSPTDPNTVFIGTNLRSYKTTDGASNWESKSYWWVPNQFSLPYMHADHHGIAFGANSNTVYYATDGGFFVSTDGGTSWEERNNGLLCTQIYRNANSATEEKKWMMGTQDNSVYVSKTDGAWVYIPWFGDGFECIVDAEAPNYVYATGYYGSNILFSHKGGESKNDWYYLRDRDGNNGIPQSEQGGWVIPFVADPLDSTELYVGLVNIYKTKMTRKAPTEDPVQPTFQKIFTGSDSVNIMEVMRLSYGPDNRKIFFTQSRYSQQSGWQLGMYRMNLDGSNLEQITMPRLGFVNEIACDPNNNNNVWIGYSDIGLYPSEQTRIYKSENMGDTWIDKTNNLPKTLPVSAIFIDPMNSNSIIAGTDLGCYRSDDDGETWYEFNTGLPNAVVTDLAYYPQGRKLRVATYGRGMWETSLDGDAEPDIRIEPLDISFP